MEAGGLPQGPLPGEGTRTGGGGLGPQRARGLERFPWTVGKRSSVCLSEQLLPPRPSPPGLGAPGCTSCGVLPSPVLLQRLPAATLWSPLGTLSAAPPIGAASPASQHLCFHVLSLLLSSLCLLVDGRSCLPLPGKASSLPLLGYTMARCPFRPRAQLPSGPWTCLPVEYSPAAPGHRALPLRLSLA